ncbi:VIT family protein [Paracoccus aestuariivivens]|uniref:VIT family protein n=1 Tax=Paracoccus aestuariivivens TaxID=1820333 RepID=A0A6L6J4J3_9RHOB|nr:VIT family protein [Paracoccus aestuariivivens]MTH77012.1 VIT family protein [Paracoccus aestuariivivens]
MTTRLLDPISRASEILFGLIMVLTFTASLNVAEAGREDVRLMLIGALGCNLAWGLIDAAMYLLSTRAEKALALHSFEAVRAAPTPADARHRITAALPPFAAEALGEADLERIRQHLLGLPAPSRQTRPSPADLLAAALVFAMVFAATLPVVLPFLLVEDARHALYWSHGIAVASLFIAGSTLGRHWGQAWRVGLAMVVLGLILVGIAIALGG